MFIDESSANLTLLDQVRLLVIRPRMSRESITATIVNIHCNFAYSVLACFSTGMLRSASFQRLRKS